jgi:hypothetical protein
MRIMRMALMMISAIITMLHHAAVQHALMHTAPGAS